MFLDVRFCRDFVLGFVLGKFLDSLGKLVEELAKNNENQIRSGGVWGRVGAAENIPKVSQEARKIIPKSSKIEPGSRVWETEAGDS